MKARNLPRPSTPTDQARPRPQGRLALVETASRRVEQSRRAGHGARRTPSRPCRSRTGALEAALDRSVGRSALVASLGNLRATAQSGRPFDAELQTVRALSITLQAPQLTAPLDRLSDVAQTGLPTVVGLQRAFATLAGRAARGTPPGETTWVGQTLGPDVTSLVTVRRTGQIEGQSAEAVVARTESLLQEGDLARAVAEVRVSCRQSVARDRCVAGARASYGSVPNKRSMISAPWCWPSAGQGNAWLAPSPRSSSHHRCGGLGRVARRSTGTTRHGLAWIPNRNAGRAWALALRWC